MSFRVVFSNEALLQLKKLDNESVRRILGKMEKARNDPFHYTERLVGREDYKIRAGDYRILVKIDSRERIIFVLSLGHRKSIYKSK